MPRKDRPRITSKAAAMMVEDSGLTRTELLSAALQGGQTDLARAMSRHINVEARQGTGKRSSATPAPEKTALLQNLAALAREAREEEAKQDEEAALAKEPMLEAYLRNIRFGPLDDPRSYDTDMKHSAALLVEFSDKDPRIMAVIESQLIDKGGEFTPQAQLAHATLRIGRTNPDTKYVALQLIKNDEGFAAAFLKAAESELHAETILAATAGDAPRQHEGKGLTNPAYDPEIGEGPEGRK